MNLPVLNKRRGIAFQLANRPALLIRSNRRPRRDLRLARAIFLVLRISVEVPDPAVQKPIKIGGCRFCDVADSIGIGDRFAAFPLRNSLRRHA